MKHHLVVLGLIVAIAMTGCATNSTSIASESANSPETTSSSVPDGDGGAALAKTGTPSFKTVVVGSACNTAMSNAARVPLSQTNDAEFIATSTACSTMDEWASALRANPKALGVTSLTGSDIYYSLIATCSNAVAAGASAPMCAEADAAGYLNG